MAGKADNELKNNQEAILLLRELDETFMRYGASEAIKTLAEVRMLVPFTKEVKRILSDYQATLIFWHAGYFREVQNVFYKTGPRRALVKLGNRTYPTDARERSIHFACQKTLQGMVDRRGYCHPYLDGDPQVQSLSALTEKQLAKGVKL